MSTLYPTPPPQIWESKPLVAIDIGWATSLRKLYRDLEEFVNNWRPKIVSEYDQEIPQSQTADNPVAPLNHHQTPGRQIKQSKQLSLPHQDDCNTRMGI